MAVKEKIIKTNDGLPKEAFAITGDPEDAQTWQLSHHTKAILRTLKGKLELEQTVDWQKIETAVMALSPRRHPGQRVQADPEQIIAASRHLASHYQKAGKPLPDTLAALV